MASFPCRLAQLQRAGMINCEVCRVERESRYTLGFIDQADYAVNTDTRDQVCFLLLVH